eukprot:gnl/TRDRNA2_/TRDRNA2_135905_c1_seq1.p1 gnl/TRDRNA2_/TRDRNA2_135905_c1~~gnl/TRDRNA2_/TRDRNA2_135905_c1_seq1.p1  ORF type:complete len:101 (+),score=4.25 gnl/TRDRNA2_/TRDRNA2_135905_c1_seq1:384-686(+)
MGLNHILILNENSCICTLQYLVLLPRSVHVLHRNAALSLMASDGPIVNLTLTSFRWPFFLVQEGLLLLVKACTVFLWFLGDTPLHPTVQDMRTSSLPRSR